MWLDVRWLVTVNIRLESIVHNEAVSEYTCFQWKDIYAYINPFGLRLMCATPITISWQSWYRLSIDLSHVVEASVWSLKVGHTLWHLTQDSVLWRFLAFNWKTFLFNRLLKSQESWTMCRRLVVIWKTFHFRLTLSTTNKPTNMRIYIWIEDYNNYYYQGR